MFLARFVLVVSFLLVFGCAIAGMLPLWRHERLQWTMYGYVILFLYLVPVRRLCGSYGLRCWYTCTTLDMLMGMSGCLAVVLFAQDALRLAHSIELAGAAVLIMLAIFQLKFALIATQEASPKQKSFVYGWQNTKKTRTAARFAWPDQIYVG